MKELITMGEFIIQRQEDFPFAQGELSRLLSAIRLAAKVMNSQISKAGLVDSILGSMGSQNIQGEEQKKLDLYANDLFIKTLKARNEVCGIASEEEERFVLFENESGMNGKYVVLIDPIDGSSNIEVNVSIGTIFSIYRRVSPVGTPAVLEDFLQPGDKQVAAGYIIFGSSTMLVFTTGNGVNGFTYDPNVGVFYLSHPDIKIPKDGTIYSVNEGNYGYFSTEVQGYINYCKALDSNTNRPYSGRYIGSMIADFHRNLLKGGIYMYPATSISPKGKLRLLYECNPMAYLMEQAGGAATDGNKRIMEISPEELHERTALFVGSSNMIEKVKNFLDKSHDEG